MVLSLAAILFSPEKWQRLAKANFSNGGSQCFTVVFAIPKTGNRLGNHMFYYAGVLYVAWLTGRRPILLYSSNQTRLDKAFDLDIAVVGEEKRCPVKHFLHSFVYAYNIGVKDLINVDSDVSIQLKGAFCSWKYTQPIEDQLRRKLRFHRNLTNFAKKFLSTNVPRGWNVSTFVRVGVHVRRGDFLKSWAVERGFTVASREYLYRSMTYFVDRYRRVQFIVSSDDIGWCRENIKPSTFNQGRINITFSSEHSTEQDLALLASCDHTVMTTGTYSWWASWLANGTTVYYEKFPRLESLLWHRSRVADYFLPTWIGMDWKVDFL